MRSNDFDRIAKWYDLLVNIVFGKNIKRAQTAFLSQLPAEGRVLIMGGGTGWILTEMLTIRPNLMIDYVEASAEMLKLARQKASAGNIEFIHGTEADIPGEKYDIIITNFFLDVFREERLKSVMFVLKDKLDKKGLWLCSDFQNTNRFYHKVLVKLMHSFFRSVSRLESKQLKDFHPHFVERGLIMIEEKLFYRRIIFSRVYKPI